jgi:hypothetical protein
MLREKMENYGWKEVSRENWITFLIYKSIFRIKNNVDVKKEIFYQIHD